MNKYRVMYRPTEHSSDVSAKTEEVWADGWRVDYDKVVLFAHEQDADILVMDIPKTRVMRIQQVG